MKDLNKDPSEMTEAERWDAFRTILALALVEAWEEGRLTLPEQDPHKEE